MLHVTAVCVIVKSRKDRGDLSNTRSAILDPRCLGSRGATIQAPRGVILARDPNVGHIILRVYV